MEKKRLPAKIDVLDLFCGDGKRILQLAKRHPDKVFVGVDKHRTMDKRKLPPNVHFVQSDVLEFLRSRKRGGTVRHINADFGVGFLRPEDRPQFYWQVKTLLIPKGRFTISAYDERTNAPSDLVHYEVKESGFNLDKRERIDIRSIIRPGSTISTFGFSVGGITKSCATRLRFRKK